MRERAAAACWAAEAIAVLAASVSRAEMDACADTRSSRAAVSSATTPRCAEPEPGDSPDEDDDHGPDRYGQTATAQVGHSSTQASDHFGPVTVHVTPMMSPTCRYTYAMAPRVSERR